MLRSLTRQLENDAGNNHAKTKTYQVYIAVCSFPPFNQVMDKVLQSDTEDISVNVVTSFFSHKRREGQEVMLCTLHMK